MATLENGTEPVCKITSIFFNYYQAERELQHNPHPECGINVMPQDISRFPTIPYNAVAFAMDVTDPKAYAKDAPVLPYNKKLKLHAEFKGQPNSEVLIRTVDPKATNVKDLETYLEKAQVSIDLYGKAIHSTRLLGDIEPITIKFNENGNAISDLNEGVIELTIDSADIWSRGIYASWQLWQWQYSTDKGKTWAVADGLFFEGVSVHRIFITKNPATWPWTGYDEDAKDISGQYSISRPPYIQALEWACKWAEGETTDVGIASKITAGLNDSKDTRFKYGPSGANNYTSVYHNFFDCGRFIDRLNGKFGRGPNVNCVDCAHMVISLANALGCQLQPGRIQNPETAEGSIPFQLNPLTLIGYTELNPPGKTFNYHQVAVMPGSDDKTPDSIYDACIKFDTTIFEEVVKMKSPDEPVELLSPEQKHNHPVDIPVGKNVFTYGYMAILAKSLDTPSQKNIEMLKGEEQAFSISALKFN